MADVWEDAKEKVSKSLQEVGLSDKVTGECACDPLNKMDKSGEYIDIHTGPIEKRGVETDENCSNCDQIGVTSEKTSSEPSPCGNTVLGRTVEYKGDSQLAKELSDNCDDLCKHETDQFGEGEEDEEEEYLSADEGEEEIVVDEDLLKELEEKMTEAEKEEKHKEAKEEKEKGNSFFKESSYKDAIKCYSCALQCCPLSFPKDRSIMYSNRAACKMRMEHYEEAITDSTCAIELNPCYLKALMRRAELYEKTDKLDEALSDYQKIFEMDPSQYAARAACARLPEQIKERNEKMKNEMIGKLKDLGNMVLKPFGLSTDNFQLNQDPQTGSYSVNFNQNGK